jgi:hypothetical protein
MTAASVSTTEIWAARLAILSSVLVLACSSVGDDGDPDAGVQTPAGGGGGAGGGAADGALHEWVRQACARPAGDRVPVASPDEMRDLLVGHWVLCTADGVTSQPHAGIEIGADDRWRLLGWSGDQLVRRAGLDNTGSAQYEAAGVNEIQTNWITDFGWTHIGFTAVENDPRAFAFTDTGAGHVPRYVRLDAAVDVVSDEPPRDTDPVPPSLEGPTHTLIREACARPLGERLWVASPGEMRDVLVGAWAVCSDEGLAFRPQAGIEVGADDRWRLLGWSGDQLVRRVGLDNAGSVDYLDASQPGLPLTQVDWKSDYGFGAGGFPVVSDDPRGFLVAEDDLGHGPRYVRLSSSVAIADEPRPPTPPPYAGTGRLRDWVTAMCALPLGDRLWPPTALEMHDLLAGRWALCSAGGIFGRPQQGLAVGADDRWQLLAWSNDDLIPVPGAGTSGTTEYIELGPSDIQVDWVDDDQLTVISHAVISDDPRVLIVPGSAIDAADEARYVRIP